jgi:preprotein translocase subunit SecE
MASNEASQQANRSGMDPKRLVAIFLLFTALVLAGFFEHLLAGIWDQLGWPKYEIIEGWDATTVLGVVLALGTVIGVYVHPKTHQLAIDVASELMRVTWPSWDETRASTVAVVVASLVAAGVLYGIDALAYRIMVYWLPGLWGLREKL